MDIRIMEYYLAIVREGNISAAAEALHVSQPALSRQIKDLEDELGAKLFDRGNRKIKLTEEGMILRRRAEEMVRLMQITESEIGQAHNIISGEIHIGAGESLAFRYISKIAGAIHKSYLDVRFYITSGDTTDLMEQLNNGLLDAVLIFNDYDKELYQGIPLPSKDRLGILVRKDDSLALRKEISISELKDIPLIIPREAVNIFASDPRLSDMNIVTIYNLIYNASLFVENKVGYAIGFIDLINTTGDSALKYIPITDIVLDPGVVIWKKYKIFNSAVNLFLDQLKKI
ncbi:LysR family transcriptional regulator [Lachnospiraceae bacterium C1.1]|nr:LysR family transcriptional regulator [Lachnospiraceae bacterium C1.1]